MHIIQIATLATAAITIVGAALIVPAPSRRPEIIFMLFAIPIWRAPAYIAADIPLSGGARAIK